MKKIALLSTLSVALLASFAVHAADTTELKVTGKITPGACVPTFTGSGTVDYGVIAANTLKADAVNVLGTKPIAFSVSCDSVTKVAIRTTDNRKSSVVAGLLGSAFSGWADTASYGLGTASGTKIGAYRLYLHKNNVTVDGKTPDLIADATGSGAWASTANEVAMYSDGASRLSVAEFGTLAPLAFKTLTASVLVQPVLDKGANLPLTQQIDLDGSASLELTYL